MCLQLFCGASRFYGRDIRASAILNGDVDPPFEVQELYTILDDYVEKYTNDWQRRHSKTPSNRPLGLSVCPSKVIIELNNYFHFVFVFKTESLSVAMELCLKLNMVLGLIFNVELASEMN